MNSFTQECYTRILRQELVSAMGCTEPIAIAYAAAKAREVLGRMPSRIIAACSGNIIKNVKSVTVPSTNGMQGIAASAIIGAVGGDASRRLEVLTAVTEEDIAIAHKLAEEEICEVQLLEGVPNLDIIITATEGRDSALVEICHSHTNITRIERNGVTLFSADSAPAAEQPDMDAALLNLTDIYTYANTVDLAEIQDILAQQISQNLNIAEEGLANPYGANVGKTILKHRGGSWEDRAAAYAAAGSDARMSGCSMPVVINSGSGNQGITVSLPVYVCAKHLGVSEETLYRALAFSNLIAIYQKRQLGKLSAYCGAVSAATGSGAAITYLHGGSIAQIGRTITNTIANISGIVCDGAKSSCAAKIAASVDAAIMAHYMSMDDNVFLPGEGLVREDPEATISAYTTVGRVGMADTDVTILNMMI